jgi:hypothetical protein
MTTANEPSWPVLPPPDLSDAYADLPQSWKTGAVLLANRLLAAAYRADVLEVVERVVRDVEAGAIRGMTIDDYLDEQTEGHPRVVDINLALQCLQYSPAPQELWAGRVRVPEAARVCFRADVEAEFEARGVLGESGSEGVDLDPGESPF